MAMGLYNKTLNGGDPMLQSIDICLDEQQPETRLVRFESCRNIFLGTTSNDERNVLYTKVTFNADDFEGRINRKKITLTFIDVDMYERNKDSVLDFSHVFIVAKSVTWRFVRSLKDEVRDRLIMFSMDKYLVIPLNFDGYRFEPYGIEFDGVTYSRSRKPKISIHDLEIIDLIYFGKIIPKMENQIRLYSVLGNLDIKMSDIERAISANTSEKHSIL